jgi:teichuronic acid biosynthesis glycosyltransferase TuaG
MEEILVSVVIPAYNSANRIHLALDSALAQDVPLEIIVIDDCSQDNLDEVMERYLQFPQIRYFKNPENLRVAATRNRGVSLARGAYVAFLDSDDYWEKGKLQKQLALLAETGAVMCSTARELMNPDGSLTGHIIPVQTEYTYRDLLRQNPINCSSVVIRTAVAREFPMHHDDAHEDYLMWLEVLEKYGRCCAINEPLLKYRVTSTGESGTKLNSARMTFMTYRYKGFGFFRSMLYFVSYAFHGFRKYFSWFLK